MIPFLPASPALPAAPQPGTSTAQTDRAMGPNDGSVDFAKFLFGSPAQQRTADAVLLTVSQSTSDEQADVDMIEQYGAPDNIAPDVTPGAVGEAISTDFTRPGPISLTETETVRDAAIWQSRFTPFDTPAARADGSRKPSEVPPSAPQTPLPDRANASAAVVPARPTELGPLVRPTAGPVVHGNRPISNDIGQTPKAQGAAAASANADPATESAVVAARSDTPDAQTGLPSLSANSQKPDDPTNPIGRRAVSDHNTPKADAVSRYGAGDGATPANPAPLSSPRTVAPAVPLKPGGIAADLAAPVAQYAVAAPTATYLRPTVDLVETTHRAHPAPTTKDDGVFDTDRKPGPDRGSTPGAIDRPAPSKPDSPKNSFAGPVTQAVPVPADAGPYGRSHLSTAALVDGPGPAKGPSAVDAARIVASLPVVGLSKSPSWQPAPPEAAPSTATRPSADSATLPATTSVISQPVAAPAVPTGQRTIAETSARLLQGDPTPRADLAVPADRPALHSVAQVTTTPTEQARMVAQQIAQALPSTLPGTTEITLQPEELGRVRMTLSVQDGALTLMIQTDRPETSDLIRRHLDQLGQTFRQMGFDSLNLGFAGSAQRGVPFATATPDTAPDEGEPAPMQVLDPRPAVRTDGRLDLRM